VSRLRANALLLLVALIWGSAFVGQSLGMADVGPMLFTGVRFLLGALLVLPLVWREWRYLHGRGLRFDRDDALQVLGLGLLLLLGSCWQQIGIVGTSVTNAGFLTAVYVPLVPLLGWLRFGQRPHWVTWPAAIACVVGTWLLSGAGRLTIGTGDLWVLASSLPWAVHVLFVGRVAQRMGAPFLVACGQFVVCGVGALAWALVAEPIAWQGLVGAAGHIAYTGFVSVGLGYTAQVVAQRSAHPADAAIILSSETLFAALFGYLFMGDRLGIAGLLGCATIFASIVCVQLVPMLARRATPLQAATAPHAVP